MDVTNSISELASLGSFVTNVPAGLKILGLESSSAVSVLALLLLSGAEIEHLSLPLSIPPDAARELGPAIRQHQWIRELSAGWGSYPTLELIKTILASMSSRLEALEVYNARIDRGCPGFCSSVKNCVTLRTLRLANCGISGDALGEAIGSLQSLEVVDLAEDGQTDDKEVVPVVAALGKLRGLNELRFLGQPMRGNCNEAMSRLNLKQIRVLNLTKCKLGDNEVSAIVSAVRKARGLEVLILSDNKIGPVGGEKLAQLTAHSPRLRSLALTKTNWIKTAPLAAIGRAIVSCSGTLSELDFSSCKIKSEGAAALFGPTKAQSATHKPAMASLKLCNNYLCDNGIPAVADYVARCAKTISELYLGSNNITQTGAKELAKVLWNADSLRVLDMSANIIKAEGAVSLLESLATPGSHAMRLLSLKGCLICDEGGMAAAKFILSRGCEVLDLSRNFIGKKGFNAIVDAVAGSGIIMDKLNLSNNPAQEGGAKRLAERLIMPNQHVRYLDIKRVWMGNEGAKAIASAIRQRNEGVLQSVDVKSEDFGEEGLAALQQATPEPILRIVQ